MKIRMNELFLKRMLAAQIPVQALSNPAINPSVAADDPVRLCRHPVIRQALSHLSLRGAKRRGNLVQALSNPAINPFVAAAISASAGTP